MLGISRQRLKRIPFVKDVDDAQMRLISPPSEGRESVLMIERNDVIYISVKYAARISGCTISAIYQKVKKKIIPSVSYRGTIFVPEELYKKC